MQCRRHRGLREEASGWKGAGSRQPISKLYAGKKKSTSDSQARLARNQGADLQASNSDEAERGRETRFTSRQHSHWQWQPTALDSAPRSPGSRPCAAGVASRVARAIRRGAGARLCCDPPAEAPRDDRRRLRLAPRALQAPQRRRRRGGAAGAGEVARQRQRRGGERVRRGGGRSWDPATTAAAAASAPLPLGCPPRPRPRRPRHRRHRCCSVSAALRLCGGGPAGVDYCQRGRGSDKRGH